MIKRLKEGISFSTGRPEDRYATLKKQTKRGVTLVVENYQLGEKLGKGAFGVVYKGLDVSSGQFVAVKRIERAAHNSMSAHEIELLSKLEHPHIVRYIRLVESANHYNLILEFVDRHSLIELLTKKHPQFFVWIVAMALGQVAKN